MNEVKKGFNVVLYKATRKIEFLPTPLHAKLLCFIFLPFHSQFLEPKYGYFHCKDCKIRWESAYVWCISGTNKVRVCGWDMGKGMGIE